MLIPLKILTSEFTLYKEQNEYEKQIIHLNSKSNPRRQPKRGRTTQLRQQTQDYRCGNLNHQHDYL